MSSYCSLDKSNSVLPGYCPVGDSGITHAGTRGVVLETIGIACLSSSEAVIAHRQLKVLPPISHAGLFEDSSSTMATSLEMSSVVEVETRQAGVPVRSELNLGKPYDRTVQVWRSMKRLYLVRSRFLLHDRQCNDQSA